MILLRLAAQNLARGRARATLLGLAVMLAVAVAMAGPAIGWSLREAGRTALARLGADLVVVPHGAVMPEGGALLAAPAVDAAREMEGALAARIAAVPGIARVAPQRVLQAEIDGRVVTLIGYDPERDMTLRAWSTGPPAPRGALMGAAARGRPGEVISVCGYPLPLAGRLARTGVPRLDEAYAAPLPVLAEILANWEMICRAAGVPPGSAGSDPAGGHVMDPATVPRADAHGGIPGYGNCLPMDLPPAGRATGFLLELASGTTAEAARFALGRIAGIDIVAGDGAVTAFRQSFDRVLLGAAGLGALLLGALFLLVWMLFGAIVQERRREMGLLLAAGARPVQLRRLMLAEAAIVTLGGAMLGLGLGLLLQRLALGAIAMQLASVGVPFAAPPVALVLPLAAAALAGAAALGLGGALFHAWRAGRLDPQVLIQGGAGR